MNKNENINLLPILKPLWFKENFIERMTGEKLHSPGLLIIADDDEYFYFLSCYDRKIEEQDYDNPKDIIEVIKGDGITDEGELKEIEDLYAIDLSKIFKIKRKDMYLNLKTKDYEMDDLPYLGVKNQLQVVDRIGEKINSDKDKPKMVLIMRGEKTALKASIN